MPLPSDDQLNARQTATIETYTAIRLAVAKLYCASGCSCCRDTEGWEAASKELGELLGAEPYPDGSGYDWHAIKRAAEGKS